LLKSWEEADPRLEHPELVDDAVAETLSFVADRPGEVEEWLGPEPVVTPPGDISIPAVRPTAVAQPSPEPTANSLRIRWLHVTAGGLATHLHASMAGEVKQTAAIATAGGRVSACSIEASVPEAGDLTISCDLSREVRRRLRARWLRLEVRTRFAPRVGEAETLSRRVFLPRS
jgi:hypothetical protein